MRIEPRHAFDDFTRARIAQRPANRPPSLVSVLPHHHVVSRVHWIDAFRQVLDAKRAFETRVVECLDPPAHTLLHRGSDRLRNPAVDIVHDRILDRAVRVRRIHALEAVPSDPSLIEQCLNRLAVVLERDREISDAWIERARLIPGVGQRQQRQMLAKRDRRRIGKDRRHDVAWSAPRERERQRRINLRILRKCLGVWRKNGRTIARQRIRALFVVAQRRRDVHPVPKHHVAGIDEHTAAGVFTNDWKRRDRAGRERLAHAPRVVRVRRRAPIVPVFQNQQDLVPRAIETRHIGADIVRAVQPDRVGSQTRRKRNEQ